MKLNAVFHNLGEKKAQMYQMRYQIKNKYLFYQMVPLDLENGL